MREALDHAKAIRGGRSVAQVLSYRIADAHRIEEPRPERAVPEDLPSRSVGL
jgi:hypothetical protein